MDITTQLALQSQATRLTERIPGGGVRTERGYDPLRLAVSTTNYTRSPLRNSFQTTIRHLKGADFHIELIPLHSPLLRESLLVSFPPLSYMLKFSGSSCVTETQEMSVSGYRDGVLCPKAQDWSSPPPPRAPCEVRTYDSRPGGKCSKA